jgi:hypothetical protein
VNAFIPLYTFLDRLLPLTEDQMRRFSSLFTATTLAKGEHLLRVGDSFLIYISAYQAVFVYTTAPMMASTDD